MVTMLINTAGIFNYYLGISAIDIHKRFLEFNSKSEIVKEKKIAGEVEILLQSINDSLKTEKGCVGVLAKQIKDLGKIKRKDAKEKGLKDNDGNCIKHTDYFNNIGLKSLISVFNQSPIYINYVMEKTDDNLINRRKFRKNDVFDSGIISHLNTSNCLSVLTLDKKLLEIMELLSANKNQDIETYVISNIFESIKVSKEINNYFQ